MPGVRFQGPGTGGLGLGTEGILDFRFWIFDWPFACATLDLLISACRPFPTAVFFPSPQPLAPSPCF